MEHVAECYADSLRGTGYTPLQLAECAQNICYAYLWCKQSHTLHYVFRLVFCCNIARDAAGSKPQRLAIAMFAISGAARWSKTSSR